MRFSIFTPTHRPTYIGELFEALLKQTFTDWEWVIVPNGPDAEIPDQITAHPQVRIVPAPEHIREKGIGALKLFACQQCEGDYLVEVDHDDILTDNALAAVEAKAKATDAGMLYSDFANFYADGSPQIFFESHGWEHYDFHYEGRDYIAMRAFETTPAALYAIGYAPNHVRVWKRSEYFRVGGHDPDFRICDDHDLLVRCYLAGVEFAHVPECIYLYRLLEGGDNSYLEYNAEIQTTQQEIGAKNLYPMIAEWCKRENLPMLDLGGAHNSPPGFKSVDLRNADINCDIRDGLPLPDDSVGCIRAKDFLEHIPSCPDSACEHGANGGQLCTVGLMNEFYRVLAPGGWLVSQTPSSDGRGAFQDPTHVSFWNPNSFWYYTDAEIAKYVEGVTCRFQDTRLIQVFPTPWHEEHNIPYVVADLCALKGQRQPGMVKI